MLLFSQSVRMLDIISDYMRLRGFTHQRLDGSTPAQQRHQVRGCGGVSCAVVCYERRGRAVERASRHSVGGRERGPPLPYLPVLLLTNL